MPLYRKFERRIDYNHGNITGSPEVLSGGGHRDY